ncbi:MAG TPA: SIMPL domain-containing protein [bacterium]|nr:SIMPL domain-containing protein [bacterium]
MRTNTRILVMLAVAAAVAAMPVWSNAQETLSTGAANTAHTIVVAGQGSVNDTPDQTSVTLGVETTKTTAQDAQNANSATMTEIIRQIAAVGIPADQMRTTGVELNPQRRPGPGNGQITGYTATNRIVVTVNDLRLTGRVIDAGVGAGANEVAGISFGLRDAKADQTRALRLAVQNAKDTATILAQAAGVGPLRLVRLEVLGEASPTPRIALAAAQSVETPVLPGMVSVTASVRAVYAF